MMIGYGHVWPFPDTGSGWSSNDCDCPGWQRLALAGLNWTGLDIAGVAMALHDLALILAELCND